jgi:hypothetical protein
MPFILVFNKSTVILKLCAHTDYMVMEVMYVCICVCVYIYIYITCFELRNSYIEIAVAVVLILEVIL